MVPRRWLIGAALAAVLGAGVLAGLDALAMRGPGPVTVLGVPGGGEPTEPALEGPGSGVLRGSVVELELEPYTVCWSSLTGGFCADGAPSEPLPEIGSPARVVVEGPTDGWRWEAVGTASTGDVAASCARSYPFPVSVGADGAITLEPGGPSGLYDVSLSGWHERGDMHVAFRWRTVADGPEPSPAASVTLVAARPGSPDAASTYGAHLDVRDLAGTPQRASATVTVTDAAGEQASLEMTPMFVVGAGCAEPGTVSLAAPDQAAEALVAQLGAGPWRHDVELVLDGVTYRASATYPGDTDEDIQPSMPLLFAPPLPSIAP